MAWWGGGGGGGANPPPHQGGPGMGGAGAPQQDDVPRYVRDIINAMGAAMVNTNTMMGNMAQNITTMSNQVQQTKHESVLVLT